MGRSEIQIWGDFNNGSMFAAAGSGAGNSNRLRLETGDLGEL